MNKVKMSKTFLNELLQNNSERIDFQIQETLKAKTSDHKILLAMDFDECALNEHISKMVSEYYWDRASVDEAALKDNSVESIASLLSCYIGLSESEFKGSIDTLVETVSLRNGFKEFFSTVLLRKDIFPVFVSSGLALAVESALISFGFENTCIIADEVKSENGTILGPFMIISDSLKGEVVRKLSVHNNFTQIVSVGHSKGDVQLIEAGSEGFRVSFRDSEEAIAVADVLIDSWTEVLELI